MGIGININNPIASEIKEIAISLKDAVGREVNLESFFLSLVVNLSSGSNIQEYKSYSAVIGKKITVVRGECSFEALCDDILDDGALLLSNGEKLYAGEVGLKIKL